jgi:gliding motility-associated-like protein
MTRRGDTLAICGSTTSQLLYTDSTSYQVQNAGGGDGFLALMDTGFALHWATFVGDTGQDGIAAATIDDEGGLYAAGTTTSSNGIAANADYTGNQLSGPKDAFLMRFNSPGDSLDWSRYLGAMNEEEARAITVMGHTAIYIGGRTSSLYDFVKNPHQLDYGGGPWDGFATRLDRRVSTVGGISNCSGCGGGSGGGGGGNVPPPEPVYHVCLGDSIMFVVYGGALGFDSEWVWYADSCGVNHLALTQGDTIVLYPDHSFTLYVRAEGTDQVTTCSYAEIVVHPVPVPVIAVSDTVCAGASISVSGTGAESFAWLLGDSVVATGPMAQFNAPMTPGILIVTGAGTNGPACTVEVTDSVVVLPAPQPVWTLQDVTCWGEADGMIALDPFTVDSLPSAGLALNWMPPGLQGPLLTGLDSGLYVATVTDGYGCQATDSLVIAMPPPLFDSISTTLALCGKPLGSATVHGPGSAPGLQYDWGQGPGTATSAFGLAPGQGQLIASDANGCQQVQTFLIAAYGMIDVDLGADTLWATDGSTTLSCTATPADSVAGYYWYPWIGLDDPEAASTACNVEDTVNYVIYVTSLAGCKVADSVVVVPQFSGGSGMALPCGDFFLPDHFSPNGDGLNDAFAAMGGCITKLELRVYDHWGGLLFHGTEPAAAWDGTHNGSAVPAGAYAFTLVATRSNGEELERAGTITLMR